MDRFVQACAAVAAVVLFLAASGLWVYAILYHLKTNTASAAQAGGACFGLGVGALAVAGILEL